MDTSFLERWDSWELMSIPLLDTSFSRAESARAKEILRQRGIFGVRRVRLQILVGFGLWWNVIWGEWTPLGFKDVVYGWSLNVGLLVALGVGAAMYKTLVAYTELGGALATFLGVPASFAVGMLARRFAHKRLIRAHVA
jgi:hypothetical protein